MEFGLKGASRVCRGRDHGEVGIVEFGHIALALSFMSSLEMNL